MLIALLYASYTDIKREEIPLWLFPSVSVLHTLIFYKSIVWKWSIIGLLIGVLSFTFLAVFFNGGGGDIIMMGTLGFVIGPKNFMYITIISSILCLCFYILKKVKKAPYVPFVALSYVFFLIGGLLYGFFNNRILEIRYFLL